VKLARLSQEQIEKWGRISGEHNINSSLFIDAQRYNCKLCPNSYTKRKSYRMHMVRKHSNEPIHSCVRCSKVWPSYKALQQHRESSCRNQPYKCYSLTVCEKVFKVRNNLDEHFNTHTGEKPFKCTICDKCFIGKRALDRHLLVHTVNPEMKYSCIFCEKRFKTKNELLLHTLRHVREKTFGCSFCSMSFLTSRQQRLHVATMHKNQPVRRTTSCFECIMCKVSLASMSNLMKHIHQHTRERPIQCRFCSNCYPTPGTCN